MTKYLALGDSYTIGESVAREDNFPSQLLRLLGIDGEPDIIAKTGWTTAELMEGIRERFGDIAAKNLADSNNNKIQTGSANSAEHAGGEHVNAWPDASYDFVTLLIGVNNQYRGLDIQEYEKDFRALLNMATGFAAGRKERVFVVSIPDWSATPFAYDRDRESVSNCIDAFNKLNRLVAEDAGISYTEITVESRKALHDNSLVAEDGLHPSAKEYRKWAEKLARVIGSALGR